MVKVNKTQSCVKGASNVYTEFLKLRSYNSKMPL